MGLAQRQLQFNQIVEFVLPAHHQALLVAALIENVQRITCTFPGFISATVQASDDGARVISQVLWESRQACEAAMINSERDEPDFITLLNRHRVRITTFDTYTVIGRVEPRSPVTVSGQIESCTS